MEGERLDAECDILRLVATRSGTTLTVCLHGELDVSCTYLLDLVDDAAARDATTVEVDFTALEFIDSTGIMALLRLRTLHTAAGRTVRFVRLQPFVRRIFSVLGLDDHVDG